MNRRKRPGRSSFGSPGAGRRRDGSPRRTVGDAEGQVNSTRRVETHQEATRERTIRPDGAYRKDGRAARLKILRLGRDGRRNWLPLPDVGPAGMFGFASLQVDQTRSRIECFGAVPWPIPPIDGVPPGSHSLRSSGRCPGRVGPRPARNDPSRSPHAPAAHTACPRAATTAARPPIRPPRPGNRPTDRARWPSRPRRIAGPDMPASARRRGRPIRHRDPNLDPPMTDAPSGSAPGRWASRCSASDPRIRRRIPSPPLSVRRAFPSTCASSIS